MHCNHLFLFFLFLRSYADAAAHVPFGIYAEFIIVSGQDNVQRDPGDGSDGQSCQSDGGAADLEGQSIAEAKAADKDNARDDQVPGLGQVYPVFYNVPYADGGDHSIEHKADAADDGGRHGSDDGGNLRDEADDDGKHGRNADDHRIIYLGKLQYAGILSVGGVGRAACKACQGGGKTISQKGTVQARIFNKVLSDGGGNGGNISDMLHHGGDGDRCHDENGCKVKFRQLKRRHADGSRRSDRCKIQDGGTVRVCDADGVHQQRGSIGNDDSHQNGDDLEHSLSPDIEDDDDSQCNKGQQPVGLGVVDGRAGQRKAYADDNGSCNHRRKKTHDLLYAGSPYDRRQHQVQKSGDHDTAAGVGNLLIGSHTRIDTAVQTGHCGKASQKGEG